jgi:hypothetical protein
MGLRIDVYGRAVIDANTGHVYRLPHTICCWPVEVENPIAYRLDSTLIVFEGIRDEKDGDDGTHYYQFRGGQFVLIRSVPRKPAAK